MRAYLTDLHVHTVLSPCASVEMTPSLVVQTAMELGLDIIAVTDHNAGDNAKAVWQAARRNACLPGAALSKNTWLCISRKRACTAPC